MFRNNSVRLIGAALMIAGISPSIPVSGLGSQADAQRPPARGFVTLRCCRCVDGSVQTVQINTGSAPWLVTPPVGAPAQAVLVPPGQIPSSWTSLPPARWVWHPTQHGVGNYVYELRIFVPRCVIRAAVSVTGRFAADNGGSLQINANPAVNTNPVTGFATSVPVPVTALVPGMNVIRVRVNNLGGPTGFLLRAAVTSRCPREQSLAPTAADLREAGDRD